MARAESATPPPPRFVTCSVTGDVLRNCWCGTPLDDELVSRNGRCQRVWIAVDADTEMRAEFYHEACWRSLREAPDHDARLIAFPVPLPATTESSAEGATPDDPTGAVAVVRRYCAAQDACPRGGALPTTALERAVIVVQVAAEHERTVAVYHAECASQTPTLEFEGSDSAGSSLSDAVARTLDRYLKSGAFGARRDTRVTVVGGGCVTAAPLTERALVGTTRSRADAAAAVADSADAYLTRVVVRETRDACACRHPPPPTMRHLVRAPLGVPWSFECFVRATRASPVHCTSWIWCKPGQLAQLCDTAYGPHARATTTRDVDDANAPRWNAVPHDRVPSEDEWFAYLAVRLTGRPMPGTSPLGLHPFAPLARIGAPVAHGLDLFTDDRGAVYLTSGVFPPSLLPPSAYQGQAQWCALPLPAYLIQP